MRGGRRIRRAGGQANVHDFLVNLKNMIPLRSAPAPKRMPRSPSEAGVSEDRTPRRPRLPTMKDIATASGVSQSSVSRVLSGAAPFVSVGEETRRRILSAAERVGYRPNPLARGLRGAGTMLIGVIVRDIADPFFATAIEAVSKAAMKLGYNVVLGHAHGRAEEAMALRAVLESRHCDAILLLGDMRDQPRLLDDLAGSRVPVVALWQGTELAGTPTVNVDNAAGIKAALDHLVGHGHRLIAFAGTPSIGDIRERRRAYVEYLKKHEITTPKGYLQNVENSPKGGAAAFNSLMALSRRPTAIVAATDLIAIGILHGAAEREIRVPAVLSVIGFDDLPIAAFTVPPLTTVRMPTAEMAQIAVHLAVMRGSSISPARGSRVRALRPLLVVRDSTGPCGTEA